MTISTLIGLKGSDSAPHPIQAKRPKEEGAGEGHGCAAGVFSQGWTSSLVLDALENGIRQGWITKEDTTREVIEGFLSRYGRNFYGVPTSPSDSVGLGSSRPRIRLERHGQTIPKSITSPDGKIEVVPFRRGQKTWSLSWIDG